MSSKVQLPEKNDVEIYKKFDEEVMGFLFPPIAMQIIEDTNVREGICIDIGAGSGLLAIELTKISNLKIIAVDIDDDMINLGKFNIKSNDLKDRIEVVKGDVHSLEYNDNYADLIVSRNSLHYWKDAELAFKEIYRVLKPGGMAYIIELRRDAPKDIVEKFKDPFGEFFQVFQDTINDSYTMDEASNMIRETKIENYELRLFQLSDQTITQSIYHLMQSPVKDPRASELSQVIIIKK